MVKILPATPFRLFKADGKGFFISTIRQVSKLKLNASMKCQPLNTPVVTYTNLTALIFDDGENKTNFFPINVSLFHILRSFCH